MAGEVYGNFEFAPKPYTRGGDVGRGAIGIPNIDPPFFLELRLIKSHTHTGVDSIILTAEATPQMVRGFKTREREERGIVTWTGSSSSAGSLTLTFGTAFLEAPTALFQVYGQTNADIQCVIEVVSATAVTIRWKDDTGGGHTSIQFMYLIKGK